MASNSGEGIHGKTDRRIVRTRDSLGEALIALMREKSFDEITVQDVLDRARVRRSTFYVHYRDKDDLFLSDVEDFLENVSTALKRGGASAERLAPVQEIFTHVREMREMYGIGEIRGNLTTSSRSPGDSLHARLRRD